MSAQHTPTPWLRRGPVILPCGPSFDAVCTVQVSNCPNWEETADFIVKACNAHDDLVGIVRDLVAYHDGGFGHPDTPIDSKIAYIEAFNRARAALAKAGAA